MEQLLLFFTQHLLLFFLTTTLCYGFSIIALIGSAISMKYLKNNILSLILITISSLLNLISKISLIVVILGVVTLILG